MTCKICKKPSDVLYKDMFDDRYGYPGTFDVYECSVCGFTQTVPELSQQQLTRLYTDYYPRKHIQVESIRSSATFRPGTWFRFTSWVRGARNVCHYHIRPGTRVLDIGCGDGSSLLDIAAAGGEAYGTEFDRNVEQPASELRLNIFFGDLQDAPYEDSFFDTITMSQLLEHIPDPVAFLRLAKVKLKPGGRVIASFPNRNSVNQKKSGRNWVNWHIPYHLNFFTPRSIAAFALAAGLEVETIKTITPNMWLLLQARANRHEAKMGHPSPVWAPLATADDNGKPLSMRALWQRRFSVGFALLYSLVRIPLTRLQDALGRGDSFLIVLKKPLQ